MIVAFPFVNDNYLADAKQGIVTIQVPPAQLHQSRHRRVALERHDEGLVGIDGLLVESREVGTDGGEGGSALRGAETAGDLLLELGHAHRAFGQVVVERGAQIDDEEQDRVAMVATGAASRAAASRTMV
jgi:hypothetical protein